jgi:hypothetical protein
VETGNRLSRELDVEFIAASTGSPVLRRGERLGRYGSAVPILGTFLVIFSTDVIRYTKMQYLFAVIGISLVGQVMVWIGMENLRRCKGWDSGIVFYLWAGALMTTIAVYGTVLSLYGVTVFPPAILPWVAPVVGSLARRRLVRGRRGEGAA